MFGDLSGLPPVLVQASEAEMLFDDARRYVNKAVAAGSPATLCRPCPTWSTSGSCFTLDLPEGREAFEAIRAFLHTRS